MAVRAQTVKRQPEMKMTELNEIFNEFARAFVGTITSDRDVALPMELPRHQLDGSLDSLHVVDAYLAKVHRQRRNISEEEWHTTVLCRSTKSPVSSKTEPRTQSISSQSAT